MRGNCTVPARSECTRPNSSAARGSTAKTIPRIYRCAACGLLILGSLTFAGAARPGTAKIVGLGATGCSQFSSDVRLNPAIRRDYLAWAQGFMSGILLGRPAGTDTGLNLNPATFGLLDQLRFLEDHCARNLSVEFSEAVEALYKRLRKEGGI